MPQIRLKLYTSLRKHIDGAPSVDVQIEVGTTVEQVLEQTGVPAEQARIIFLNGRSAQLGDLLSGEEQVEVFPAIGGG